MARRKIRDLFSAIAAWWRGEFPVSPLTLASLGDRFAAVELAGLESDIEDRREERNIRVSMSRWILWVFTALNLAVITLVIWAYSKDQALIGSKIIQPEGRLVTERVLMALIGATAVQVGVAITTMVIHFFPSNGKAKPPKPADRKAKDRKPKSAHASEPLVEPAEPVEVAE